MLKQVWRSAHIRRRRTSIAALLAIPGAATAQLPPAEDGNRAAAFAQILTPLNRSDAPGCAMAVMRSGRIAWQGIAGMADLERNVPLGPDSRFMIASASKQFTAMAIVLLALDGRLALDDDARKFIPELPVFSAPITIRHLLWHTSGLREESNLLVMAGWRSSDLQTESDILGLLHRQRRLNFRPGEEYLYSNTNYMLLAMIASRVAGMPFRDLVAKRIFAPLGMTASEVVDDPARVIPSRAIGYWAAEGGRRRVARLPYAFAGPTGVVTTLADFARWEANFYEPRVGGQEAKRLMNAPGRLNDGSPTGYGMGVYLGEYRGQRTIGHAGSDPGFKAEYIRFPEAKLAVAVFCNSFDAASTALAHRLADLSLPNAATDPTKERGPADPAVPLTAGAAAFAGRYWNAEIAQAATFLYEDGKLFIDGGGEGNFELRHLGGDRFLLPAASRRYVVAFTRTADGARRARKEIAGERSRDFAAIGLTGAVPAAAYAGRYYSFELDIEWTVLVRDGQLRVIWPRFSEEVLQPLLPHVFQFSSGFFTIAFDPPTVGATSAFEVSTERARRIRFVRALRTADR